MLARAGGERPAQAWAADRLTPTLRPADGAAPMISELLFGEAFDVLFEQDGFAFGQGRRDGYVGFVRLADLGSAGEAPTHRVSALSTPAFSRADIKAGETVFISATIGADNTITAARVQVSTNGVKPTQ